ncbi:MAG: NAD(P)-dependent oxidoreductase [Micrococcales bacterium]
MSKVIVFGATGYTGNNIAREAAARSHEVVGVARNIEGKHIEGVQLVQADISDLDNFAHLVRSADVVVLAVHHAHPKIAEMIPAIATAIRHAGARLAVVGGAGSLFVSEGGPRVFDTPEFPDAYKAEAHSAFETLQVLQKEHDLDWFYISPAGHYGGFNPGTRTGDYRLGKDSLVIDEHGKSYISGEDYAIAFIDEIDMKRHKNQRFTVGY